METRREVAERVYHAMGRILASPAHHRVIVTYSFAMTCVVADWIGIPLETAGLIGVPVTGGGITTLRRKSPFHNCGIVALNDTSHLT